MKLPHGIEPGTIFRKRWGHGRSAFGELCSVHWGGRDGEVRGEVRHMPSTEKFGRFGMVRDGKPMCSVNLLDLRNADMAPVFVSRIRGRR